METLAKYEEIPWSRSRQPWPRKGRDDRRVADVKSHLKRAVEIEDIDESDDEEVEDAPHISVQHLVHPAHAVMRHIDLIQHLSHRIRLKF